MKDSTKQILLIVVPCFLFGLIISFINGKFPGFLQWWYYILILVIFIFMMLLLSKKFTSKSLKNDEIIKKVAIISDAVAGRAALIVLIVYWMLYASDFLQYLPNFSVEYWFVILFGIMVFSATIASIYYSRNPDKLP